MKPNRMIFYAVAVSILTLGFGILYLVYSLSLKTKKIELLKAQNERILAETGKLELERDMSIARCKMLEKAIENAAKREYTKHTGPVTEVVVSPEGETTTTTIIPEITETIVESKPEYPTDIQKPQEPIYNNTFSTIVNTKTSMGVLYQRSFGRGSAGGGVMTDGTLMLSIGVRF